MLREDWIWFDKKSGEDEQQDEESGLSENEISYPGQPVLENAEARWIDKEFTQAFSFEGLRTYLLTEHIPMWQQTFGHRWAPIA